MLIKLILEMFSDVAVQNNLASSPKEWVIHKGFRDSGGQGSKRLFSGDSISILIKLQALQAVGIWYVRAYFSCRTNMPETYKSLNPLFQLNEKKTFKKKLAVLRAETNDLFGSDSFLTYDHSFHILKPPLFKKDFLSCLSFEMEFFADPRSKTF